MIKMLRHDVDLFQICGFLFSMLIVLTILSIQGLAGEHGRSGRPGSEVSCVLF